jgi:TDG/mug DNA glycosylase family protein
MALARAHRGLAVGACIEVVVPASAWSRRQVADVVVGAGFRPGQITAVPGDPRRLRTRATRLLSLPDTVGPRMTLLVSGLNPSVYAAETGVGFARPGNRFWPAALRAGLVTRDRDPIHALEAHRVGMTDVVKRATPRADELTADEYRAGLARLERLVAWLRPGAVCFVGLAGWRAEHPGAAAGIQREQLGGAPVYVMPSTSGLNARVPLAALADHLRAAWNAARGPELS